MLCSQLSLFCFHPSDTLPDRTAFYDPENMTDTHFLCQDGDMDGTGQKAFLVHAGLCLMSTLGSVPPPPAPAPPQLWDSIYLLLCSGHIHLQGSCLLLLSSPGQWLLSLAWALESYPCRPHWWFWLLLRAPPIPGFCLGGGGGEAKLQISSYWEKKTKTTRYLRSQSSGLRTLLG